MSGYCFSSVEFVCFLQRLKCNLKVVRTVKNPWAPCSYLWCPFSRHMEWHGNQASPGDWQTHQSYHPGHDQRNSLSVSTPVPVHSSAAGECGLLQWTPNKKLQPLFNILLSFHAGGFVLVCKKIIIKDLMHRHSLGVSTEMLVCKRRFQIQSNQDIILLCVNITTKSFVDEAFYSDSV